MSNCIRTAPIRVRVDIEKRTDLRNRRLRPCCQDLTKGNVTPKRRPDEDMCLTITDAKVSTLRNKTTLEKKTAKTPVRAAELSQKQEGLPRR